MVNRIAGGLHWSEDTKKLFWSKIRKTNSCWFFIGGLNHNGYGQFCVNGNNRRAHRISYELLKGKIPDGLQLDHLCRNRNCVNPEHLEIVTQKENILRGIGLTAINARKQFCIRGHELTIDNIYTTGNQRTCKQCRIASVLKCKKKKLEVIS